MVKWLAYGSLKTVELNHDYVLREFKDSYVYGTAV